MNRVSKTGARNVYQSGNKWYAQVTNNKKTYRTALLDHFFQAKEAAAACQPLDPKRRLSVAGSETWSIRDVPK